MRPDGSVGPLSVPAFARRVGVDEAAVRKAIRTGRLERCLRRLKGRLVIADVDLADQEWRTNRDPTRDGPRDRRARGRTVADARRRVLEAQYAKLRLDHDLKTGKLVALEAVEMDLMPKILQARNQLLGLSTRAKQRLPHLTASDLVVLDAIVREALEEVAAGR